MELGDYWDASIFETREFRVSVLFLCLYVFLFLYEIFCCMDIDEAREFVMLLFFGFICMNISPFGVVLFVLIFLMFLKSPSMRFVLFQSSINSVMYLVDSGQLSVFQPPPLVLVLFLVCRIRLCFSHFSVVSVVFV